MNDEPLPRAELLLIGSFVTGLSRERLLAHGSWFDLVVDRPAFDALVDRRRAGEPMAYLLSCKAFYGRDYAIDSRVLIPRPETEHLVDRVLASLDARLASDRPPRVLELGTGSGVIAITVALERPGTQVHATDVSLDALEVARCNASVLGADVRFFDGDWYRALDDERDTPRYDAIVSNPPYVAASDDHLQRGDLRFEPRGALTDGGDGLEALRRVVAGAPSRLLPDGRLAVEHGHDQGEAVRSLFTAAGFVGVETDRDLSGLERVTHGTSSGRT